MDVYKTTIFVLILHLPYFARDPLSRRIQDDITCADEEEINKLPLFDLDTIVSATDRFSFNNRIGGGGFGVVYKVIFLL